MTYRCEHCDSELDYISDPELDQCPDCGLWGSFTDSERGGEDDPDGWDCPVCWHVNTGDDDDCCECGCPRDAAEGEGAPA